MFGIFGNKPNYEKIFSSTNETHRYIYGNKSRAVDILGDKAFIDAWLSSCNVAAVTAVIRNEALKGDIPSLKQMIWVTNLYFRDVDNITNDKTEQFNLKVAFLKDRIMFCEKAISLGLKDQAYIAMVSSANLYAIIAPQKNTTDTSTRDALNGIVNHARAFISAGHDDVELIRDAQELLRQYAPIAQLSNALNQ